MKDARAALRYAKAVLNLAKDTQIEDEVNHDMLLIAGTIQDSSELKVLLKSPVIRSSEKMNVLKAVFTGKVNAVALGLFDVLQENKRLGMLESIAKQYTIIYDFLKNMQVAKVTTAVPLTKELEAKILAKIVALTGNNANLENVINPAILGGFVLRVGDMQYDASISNHLTQLKKEFDNSHFIPKI
ncbi:ATP synthase F1 subunit delta [Polaribacter sp. HL-MS24]|uniref:ATP synthase F1 subunit delta n=1 Tax=Polaribacter sp. HL-MS24 TaxID=3077735 RepID=UPI002934604C|nr:ATP synthase F1 subunit delta [Polaribacter sp. HL-MS24]WOC41134.1 ATP synthase F1 subunit delta [Polaribacter sp. HL-MS24]